MNDDSLIKDEITGRPLWADSLIEDIMRENVLILLKKLGMYIVLTINKYLDPFTREYVAKMLVITSLTYRHTNTATATFFNPNSAKTRIETAFAGQSKNSDKQSQRTLQSISLF